MGWQNSNIGKKSYLTTYQGGGTPKIMKKHKMLRCSTPKFQCFVVETAFLRKLEGGVLNIYESWSFYGLAKQQYWQKTLLDDLPGGRGGDLMKKTK